MAEEKIHKYKDANTLQALARLFIFPSSSPFMFVLSIRLFKK